MLNRNVKVHPKCPARVAKVKPIITSKKQSPVPVAVSSAGTVETSAGRETQEVKISVARTSIRMVEATVRTGETGRISLWVLNTTWTAQPRVMLSKLSFC